MMSWEDLNRDAQHVQVPVCRADLPLPPTLKEKTR